MASSAVTNGDDKAGKDKQASAPTLPNQTLFVGNLNVKVKKDDLRRALYCIFSTHGPVLDVVALKSSKMRGAAHVVYRDIPTSTQAMRALQGTDFLGKEMSIQFAKGKSNVIARLDGSAQAASAKAAAATQTAVDEVAQKSVFNNPHAALPSNPSLPAKPPTAADANKLAPPPNPTIAEEAKSPQGVKRPREDESDEDVEMEGDSDAMDESDDE